MKTYEQENLKTSGLILKVALGLATYVILQCLIDFDLKTKELSFHFLRIPDFFAGIWEQPAGKMYFIGSGVLLGLWFYLGKKFRFAIHCLHCFLGLAALNWLIVSYLPLSIKGIGSSYLIFFYHFPAAMSCFVFFLLLLVFSIKVLRDDQTYWDRAARVSGQIGLLACTITVTTGSSWARAAWGFWWDWQDKRLLTAALMWLTYAGYIILQNQIEDSFKRRRYCAVYGIMAFINIPLVHFALRVFESKHHPMQFDDLGSNDAITYTRWFSVVVFLFFYALIFRWRMHREQSKDMLDRNLSIVRRIEEDSGRKK